MLLSVASAVDNDYEDNSGSFGMPFHDLPNIHVEVDSEPVVNVNRNIESALFGEQSYVRGGPDLWDLPKLIAPEKGKAIGQSLANLINLACSSQCDIDTLVSKYKIPENCVHLCPLWLIRCGKRWIEVLMYRIRLW